MQINPMSEAAHNTALLTLTAERQELIYYREKVTELEQEIIKWRAESARHQAKAEEYAESNATLTEDRDHLQEKYQYAKGL